MLSGTSCLQKRGSLVLRRTVHPSLRRLWSRRAVLYFSHCSLSAHTTEQDPIAFLHRNSPVARARVGWPALCHRKRLYKKL